MAEGKSTLAGFKKLFLPQSNLFVKDRGCRRSITIVLA